MKRLLSAAALSVGIATMSGCRAPRPDSVASQTKEAIPSPVREQAVLKRVSTTVAAEPIPAECGCVAGNCKKPPSEACSDGVAKRAP